MDDLSICSFGCFSQEMREIGIKKCCESVIILGKLVEYSDAVNHGVVFTLSDNTGDCLSVEGVAGKTLDIWAATATCISLNCLILVFS